MDCLRFRMEVWRDWESLRATQVKLVDRDKEGIVGGGYQIGDVYVRWRG